jgi:hypothetical protein
LLLEEVKDRDFLIQGIKDEVGDLPSKLLRRRTLEGEEDSLGGERDILRHLLYWIPQRIQLAPLKGVQEHLRGSIKVYY